MRMLAFIASCGALMNLASWLFEKAEDTVNHWTKRDISRWLQNLNPTRKAKRWPEQFAAAFDGLFDKHHFTFKCF